MAKYYKKRFWALLFILILLSGCGHSQRREEISFYFTPEKINDPQELARIKGLVTGINDRKKLLRKSPDWLSDSYGSLRIKRLDEVPREKYGEYAKFIDPKDPAVYIIIHPAYYAFFVNDSVLSSRGDLDVRPSENIVDRFCARVSFYDTKLRMMQEQERGLRDFLEVMSAEKRLVILVLPKDYKSYLSYGYLDGLDEYVRYINEVAGSAESVLYVESLQYYSGYIAEDDLTALSQLTKSIGAHKIMLGGEFVGRCLDNAYSSLVRKFGKKDLYIVPEITAVTYRDIKDLPISSLFTKDGVINYRELSKNLKYSPSRYDMSQAKIRHLFIYGVNEDKIEPLN